ncbi:phosphoenolpyruvate carboxylase [bacterium]|nr:phosphoenolpyruvate carboxylase [bacterium]
MRINASIANFNRLVLNKYHIYNSLFMNLPYEKVSNIGMLIPIFHQSSKEGFEEGKNPLEIVEDFFARSTHFTSESERTDFLFRIIQYIERQVVLFDSIEDAAFEELVHDFSRHSIADLFQVASANGQKEALIQKINDFGVRIVFTAHPTQFYPPSVQRIIHDLRLAISKNSVQDINTLLQQLGKTSFLNKEKPTPYDEARSIISYLRHVYYDAIGELYGNIQDLVNNGTSFENPSLVELGFWPGGDRDGNPYVTAEITKKVANELRITLMKCYYNNLKNIRRRLTFSHIEPILNDLSDKLYSNMFSMDTPLTENDILGPLKKVREIILTQHNGLFVDLLDDLITKVTIFKTHFATMDIRQDSPIHESIIQQIITTYKLTDKPIEDLSESERIKILTTADIIVDENLFEDPLVVDTIKNIKQLKAIQQQNGEQGCNRYIISNSEDIFAVLNVYGLFRFCGWKEEDISFDIIPLFETIAGLSSAKETMSTLYKMEAYCKHLSRRNNKQTIMLGFSDGTKDGGYLKANWGIFNAKEILSEVSAQHDIKVVFFDGRGGPPARGGGKTHRFYASQGNNIANNEIQLTIQGQTITSMYGNIPQFIYNCEQLVTAGLTNEIYDDPKTDLGIEDRKLLDELADVSYQKYQALKMHDEFIPYLEEMSTLKYYGRANIGSRPGKRGDKAKLELSDLRAISFVGSWSQLKQNVPGYFGIGTAFMAMKKTGRLQEVKDLFQNSAFFKTLILNSMMSMTKTFFPLTAYMKENPRFGEFWQILFDEFELSKKMMLEISGYSTLMEEESRSKASIEIREKIVLPLLTIQQYALQKIAEKPENIKVYESMVTRSLYGNINASRNSA